ncbi:site-specific integrase [Bacteroides sp. 14(A)]|uniref:tyrosine-type recombinase/integrase n=1 Tax=Bacteroides sp. 14(A) TaxID=1163670 RepID=UPI000478548E
MTTVKVKFRPPTVADRPGSIVYRITRHRVTKSITTGYNLRPEEWDGTNPTPTATGDTHRRQAVESVSHRIRRDMERIRRIVRTLDRKGAEYSADDVACEFRRVSGAAQEGMFLGFMEGVIVRLQRLGQMGTVHNYRSVLNSFRTFRDGEDIPTGRIDAPLMEDYRSWLKAEGKAPNSVTFHIRILRAVYNRAAEEGRTADRRPFRRISTRTEKTRKRAVTWEEVKRIKELDLTGREQLAFARDLFVFLFLCRGMSFIDAAFLKKSDLRNGVITYRRHKTGQRLQIRAVEQMREIMERYPPSGESPYLLPIIAEPGHDERRQYETALHRTNKYLKKIGRMLELTLPLTTYTARHSWATAAKRKGVAIATISDALGHESQATTEVYLASIDTASIDRANDLVIGGL